MEGKMHLSGQISDWSINDLLQIMQVTKKTGSLDIEGDRRGRIHFRDGKVTGAELSASRGKYVGDDRPGVADVLYVLSSMKTGSFSVGAADGPDADGWGVEEILADVDSLEALEGEVVDAGLFEADRLRLAESIEEPITIQPEDWQALVALVRPFGFAGLEAESGRAGAVRILHALHRLGIAETFEDDEEQAETTDRDDEAGWLDRLAEDIVPESDDPTWVEKAEEGADPDATDETVIDVEKADTPPVKVTHVRTPADLRGVSAPASTTLTDGVYDEIRRLRSKVAEG